MRSSSILAASALLLSSAHAIISGIAVPCTIKPGDTFDLIIESQNYIQSVTDVTIAVGYAEGDNPAGDSLGIFLTAFDLVANSNSLSNYNKTVTFPANAEPGAATFTASVTSLYGALYAPLLSPYNVSFLIGDETSSDYIFYTA